MFTKRESDRCTVRACARVVINAFCCASFLVAGATAADLSKEQSIVAAQLQPQALTVRQQGDRLDIHGGKLGYFEAQAPFAENLRKLIERLGPLSNASKYGEFTVTEQTTGRVRFQQIIRGVPVIARNEVQVDAQGQVQEVRLSVVDPARAPRAQPIAKQRAMQIAARAYQVESGKVDAEVELDDFPGLHYEPTARGQPLKLRYRFTARIPGAARDFVTVDAITEAVEITSAVTP